LVWNEKAMVSTNEEKGFYDADSTNVESVTANMEEK
jgi:hypothetical protein